MLVYLIKAFDLKQQAYGTLMSLEHLSIDIPVPALTLDSIAIICFQTPNCYAKAQNTSGLHGEGNDPNHEGYF